MRSTGFESRGQPKMLAYSSMEECHASNVEVEVRVFLSHLKLPDSVTIARQVLILAVLVRIQIRYLK